MKTISDYKDEALEALSGNWLSGAFATLIYFLVIGAIPALCTFSFGVDSDDSLNAGSGLANIVQILLLPVAFGFYVFFLNLYRRENARVEQLFDGFKQYGRILGTLFLTGIYEFLWMLLLIIPGIVKSYSYAMTPFILKDNPSLKYNGAIEESMRLMEGHKMQLFLLDLSMIGWLILSFLTLGIGLLFLIPYNITAKAAFYQNLLAEDSSDSDDDNSDSFNETSDYEESVGGADFEEVK